jgi:hypothetical protein
MSVGHGNFDSPRHSLGVIDTCRLFYRHDHVVSDTLLVCYQHVIFICDGLAVGHGFGILVCIRFPICHKHRISVSRCHCNRIPLSDPIGSRVPVSNCLRYTVVVGQRVINLHRVSFKRILLHCHRDRIIYEFSIRILDRLLLVLGDGNRIIDLHLDEHAFHCRYSLAFFLCYGLEHWHGTGRHIVVDGC